MNMKQEELKNVEFKLDEENGDDIFAVSIVKDPAIEKSFQLFNALKLFNTAEKFTAFSDKQEITGPVMIPFIKILRYNKENNEYYNCFFSEDTVKECASVYLKHCNHTSANFDHSNAYTNNIFVIESWIVTDPENDKSKALGFSDVAKGTWFMTYKVTNEELWKEIKAGDFSGFSIEGWFTQFEKLKEEQQSLKDKEKIVYQILMSKNLSDEDKIYIIKKIVATVV